jgi:AcrR family transcriptional regulator
MVRRSPPLDVGPVRKVLEAAEQVFAERGFAGARVDDIAARAGMAKSHVYYHFQGKQQMLDQLIALRLGEILARKDALLAGVEELGPATLAAFVPTAVKELLVPYADFLRVVLLESIGVPVAGAAPEPLLLKVVRPLLDDAVRRFEALGYVLDRDAFVSDFFHFGLVPIVMHVVLGDRWAAAAGIDPDTALGLVVSRLIDLQGLNVQQLARRKSGPRAPKRGRKS